MFVSSAGFWLYLFLKAFQVFPDGAMGMESTYLDMGENNVNAPSSDFHKVFHTNNSVIAGVAVNNTGTNRKYVSKLGGARVVQHFHYELEYLLGRKIIFICIAIGDPRPNVTWYRNDLQVYAHNYFQIHKWEIGDYKIRSVIEIDPATQMDNGYYECRTANGISEDRKIFRTIFEKSS